MNGNQHTRIKPSFIEGENAALGGLHLHSEVQKQPPFGLSPSVALIRTQNLLVCGKMVRTTEGEPVSLLDSERTPLLTHQPQVCLPTFILSMTWFSCSSLLRVFRIMALRDLRDRKHGSRTAAAGGLVEAGTRLRPFPASRCKKSMYRHLTAG